MTGANKFTLENTGITGIFERRYKAIIHAAAKQDPRLVRLLNRKIYNIGLN